MTLPGACCRGVPCQQRTRFYLCATCVLVLRCNSTLPALLASRSRFNSGPEFGVLARRQAWPPRCLASCSALPSRPACWRAACRLRSSYASALQRSPWAACSSACSPRCPPLWRDACWRCAWLIKHLLACTSAARVPLSCFAPYPAAAHPRVLCEPARTLRHSAASVGCMTCMSRAVLVQSSSGSVSGGRDREAAGNLGETFFWAAATKNTVHGIAQGRGQTQHSAPQREAALAAAPAPAAERPAGRVTRRCKT